ncbi:MAG: hypothetical protein ACR2P1_14150 [Pseudomonadales bacterium]
MGAAIATEPMWLQVWLLLLGAANLAAIFFVFTKRSGKIAVRVEALAIIFSFLAAGIFMSWLYGKVGYVRLLGLPHLVFWLPVFVWLLNKYRRDEFSAPFKQYLIVYFIIAGLSLVIDAADVARYLLGDREPLHLE